MRSQARKSLEKCLAFAIEIKRKALKSIEALDSKRKGSLREVIDILKDDPVPFRRIDVVKMKGYDSVYRVRIGEHSSILGCGSSVRNE